MHKTTRFIGLLILFSLALTACAPGPSSRQGQAGATQTAEAASAADATLTAKNDPKYGWILADGKGMTLYTFKEDLPGESKCKSDCAAGWPPLTVPAGTDPSVGPRVTGKAGVIQRADGSWQVTYDQLPVYRFSGDQTPKDAAGEALGGEWNIIAIH